MKLLATFLTAIFVIGVSQVSGVNAQGFRDWIMATSYAPDGSRLAVVGMIQEVEGVFIFDRAGQELARLAIPYADGIAWSPDGRLAVRGIPDDALDYVITILDAQTLKETLRFNTSYPVDAPEIHWSPDGRMLLHYSQSNFMVWDTTDGRLLSEVELTVTQPRPIVDAFWHPVTQEIYILEKSSTILVFDPRTGEQTREPLVLKVPQSGPEWYTYAKQMEIRSDGSQIAVAFNDDQQTIQILNPETGAIIHHFTEAEPKSHPDIRELRWSPDSQQIATLTSTVTSPAEIYVWNAESGELQHVISGVGIPSISTFMFSPDGTQMALVGADTSPITRRENPAITNEAAIMVNPASAVLVNLDQIPTFMQAPN
jgi:WD40 repeat protein